MYKWVVYMAINSELNLDPMTKLKARRHLDDTGRRKVASEVKRLCDPYVPWDSGNLARTAQVLTDGVLYDQPYAAVQYYTNTGHGKQGLTKQSAHNYKCLRGAYWDKRMMADKGDQLTDTIAGFCGGEAKK